MKTREQLSKELTDAAKNGDLVAMRNALADGADINAIADSYCGTALYVAAFYGRIEAVKLLIEYGADLEIAGIGSKDNILSGSTPLLVSLAKSNTAVADLLISRGANINAKRIDNLTPLIRASENGLTSILQKLIDRGADVTNVTKKNGDALYFASANGHIRCADLIVNTLIAKYENSPEKLLALLKETNALRDSLIHAKNGFVFYYLFKLIAVLMQKLGVYEHRDIGDLLPKPEEIKYKEYRKEIISFFKTLPVKQRNDLANGALNDKGSPFYKLAGGEAAFIAQAKEMAVSSQNEIDRLKEFKDANAQVALYNAAASGDVDAAEICIKNGFAKVNERAGWNYELPLYIAAANGHADMVDFLLKNGAVIVLPFTGGKSEAHIAAENGHANVITVLAKRKNLDKYKGMLSCPLNDRGNSTPLMLAIKNDKPEAAIALIKCKALSPYWSHPRGYSELYYAVYYKQTAVLDALVDEMITFPPNDLLNELYGKSCFYDSYVYASRNNPDALAPLMRLLDYLHNHGLLNDKKTYLNKLIPENMLCKSDEFKKILLKNADYLPPEQRLQLYNRILNPDDIYGVIARIARGVKACDTTTENSFLAGVMKRRNNLERSITAAAKKLPINSQGIPEQPATQPAAVTVAVAAPAQPVLTEEQQQQPAPTASIFPALPEENVTYPLELQQYIELGAKQQEQANASQVAPVVETVQAPAVTTYENPFAEEMRMEEEKNMKIAETFATLFSVKNDAALAIPLDISFEPKKYHNPFEDDIDAPAAAPIVAKKSFNPFAIPDDVTETDLNAALDDHTQDLLTDDAAIRKVFNLPPAEKIAPATIFSPQKPAEQAPAQKPNAAAAKQGKTAVMLGAK